MKEFNPLQTTQSDLKPRSSSGSNLPENAKKLISPIEQLQLKVSVNDKQDYEQVQNILSTILQYPNTQMAQFHRDANRLGNRDIQQQNKNKAKTANDLALKAQYCPCCGFVRQQDQIKLCQNLDDIYNLGISTFLYFQTIKNLAIILIEMIIIYCIYALATNVIATGKFTDCGKTVAYMDCTTNLDYLAISLGSKQNNQTEQNKLFYYIQTWIGVGMVVVWLLTFFLLKYLQKHKQLEVDTQTISASDFSIVIQNVPEDFTQQQLQLQLNQYEKNINNIPKHLKKPLTIRNFNKGKPFNFDASQFTDQKLTKLQQQQKQMITKFAQWILQRRDSRSFSASNEQRQELYKKYKQNQQEQSKLFEQLQEKMKKKFEQNDKQTNTVVFVTLDTNQAKNMITTLNPTDYGSRLRHFITCSSSNRLTLRHKNQQLKIRVQRAPQPQDVIWSNIGFSDWQKLKRKIITYLVTIIMLGVSFAAVYGLSVAQISNSDNRYLSILISLVISIINFLISKSIRILSLYERDYTTIKYQTSLAIKSVLAQLINSIVIPMFANHFIKSNIYEKNGLADDIFMLGLTNSFVPPIMKFIDISYLIQKITAWYYSKTDKKLYLNQVELNKLYLGLQFQTGYQYIYVVNLYIFVCFFVSLQPIIAVFALVGFFLMFWAQKWALFNRMRRPVPGNDLINQAMGQLIFLGPIAYSLGSLTWSNFFPEGIPKYAIVPNLIATGISFITLIFPLSLIFSCFLQNNAQAQNKYDDNRVFLSTQYDRLNPVTAQRGFKNYMEHLEKMKQKMKNATEQEKQRMAKKFDLNAQRGHQAMNAQHMNMAQGRVNNMFFPGPAMFGPPQMMPFQMMRPMQPPPMIIPPPMMMMSQQSVIQPVANITPQFGNSQFNRPPQVSPQNMGFNQPPQNMGFNMQQSRPMHPGINQPQQQPQILGFGQPAFQQQSGFQQPGFQQSGFQQPQQFQQPFRPQYQQPFNPFNFSR